MVTGLRSKVMGRGQRSLDRGRRWWDRVGRWWDRGRMSWNRSRRSWDWGRRQGRPPPWDNDAFPLFHIFPTISQFDLFPKKCLNFILQNFWQPFLVINHKFPHFLFPCFNSFPPFRKIFLFPPTFQITRWFRKIYALFTYFACILVSLFFPWCIYASHNARTGCLWSKVIRPRSRNHGAAEYEWWKEMPKKLENSLTACRRFVFAEPITEIFLRSAAIKSVIFSSANQILTPCNSHSCGLTTHS